MAGFGLKPVKDLSYLKCEICDKVFSRSWLLKNHQRIHTGERPFKCTFCERAFSDKSNLRQHMKIHTTKEKLFQCGICDRTFAQRRYLAKHSSEIHRDTNHQSEYRLPLPKRKITVATVNAKDDGNIESGVKVEEEDIGQKSADHPHQTRYKTRKIAGLDSKTKKYSEQDLKDFIKSKEKTMEKNGFIFIKQNFDSFDSKGKEPMLTEIVDVDLTAPDKKAAGETKVMQTQRISKVKGNVAVSNPIKTVSQVKNVTGQEQLILSDSQHGAASKMKVKTAFSPSLLKTVKSPPTKPNDNKIIIVGTDGQVLQEISPPPIQSVQSQNPSLSNVKLMNLQNKNILTTSRGLSGGEPVTLVPIMQQQQLLQQNNNLVQLLQIMPGVQQIVPVQTMIDGVSMKTLPTPKTPYTQNQVFRNIRMPVSSGVNLRGMPFVTQGLNVLSAGLPHAASGLKMIGLPINNTNIPGLQTVQNLNNFVGLPGTRAPLNPASVSLEAKTVLSTTTGYQGPGAISITSDQPCYIASPIMSTSHVSGQPIPIAGATNTMSEQVKPDLKLFAVDERGDSSSVAMVNTEHLQTSPVNPIVSDASWQGVMNINSEQELLEFINSQSVTPTSQLGDKNITIFIQNVDGDNNALNASAIDNQMSQSLVGMSGFSEHETIVTEVMPEVTGVETGDLTLNDDNTDLGVDKYNQVTVVQSDLDFTESDANKTEKLVLNTDTDSDTHSHRQDYARSESSPENEMILGSIESENQRVSEQYMISSDIKHESGCPEEFKGYENDEQRLHESEHLGSDQEFKVSEQYDSERAYLEPKFEMETETDKTSLHSDDIEGSSIAIGKNYKEIKTEIDDDVNRNADSEVKDIKQETNYFNSDHGFYSIPLSESEQSVLDQGKFVVSDMETVDTGDDNDESLVIYENDESDIEDLDMDVDDNVAETESEVELSEQMKSNQADSLDQCVSRSVNYGSSDADTCVKGEEENDSEGTESVEHNLEENCDLEKGEEL